MAYETVESLIKAFREDEKDAVAPYFWSDSQLVRWINEGLTVFAEESRSFYDEDSLITQLPYAIGDDRFSLDPSIMDVVRAWVDGRPECCLTRWATGFGNAFRGGYWLAYNGCSSHFHFNPAGVLVLHPKPSESGLIRLLVIRRPLRDIQKGDCIPDMQPQDRRHLLSYMAYKAYRVSDSEIYDRAASDEHYASFAAACQKALESSILRRGSCARPIRSGW